MLAELLQLGTIVLVSLGFWLSYTTVVTKLTANTPNFSAQIVQNVIMDTLLELSENEETKQGIGAFFQTQVLQAFEQIQPQLEEQLGKELAPAKEAEELMQNVTGAAISELLPDELKWFFKNNDENWEEDAKTNPQKYMLAAQIYQKSGIGNWVNSFLGLTGVGTGPNAATQQPTPSRNNKSSWFD